MTVQRSEFVTLSATTAYIEIDIMGVADYEQPVTVKLYNAADECVSTTIDSMESYAVRQIEKNADVALFEAILAFGKGAWNYFHT